MNNLNVLAGKVLLITGGTRSFGNTVLKRLLGSGIKEIRIFSRDEKNRMIYVGKNYMSPW
jgi:UDP-glucose 4-epimerase